MTQIYGDDEIFRLCCNSFDINQRSKRIYIVLFYIILLLSPHDAPCNINSNFESQTILKRNSPSLDIQFTIALNVKENEYKQFVAQGIIIRLNVLFTICF